MTKVHKITITIILFLISLGIVIYSHLYDIRSEGIVNILSLNWLHIVASVIIVLFLLMKTYKEMTVRTHKENHFIKIVVHLTISLFIMANVLVFNVPSSILLIRGGLLMRYLLLFGMLIILEIYVFCEYGFVNRLIMSCMLIIVSAMTFMFKSHDLATIVVVYYFSVVTYLLFRFYKWESSEKTKYITLFLILLSVIYDMLVVTEIFTSPELSYLFVSIGLLIIYSKKIYDEILRLKLSEQYLDRFKEENERLVKDKVRIEQSFDKMKNDFSFKFSKKQNYFENLEMVIDVLESSLIVMNDHYKIEFAHGKLLESSGFDDLVGLDLTKTLYDDAEESTYFRSVVKKVMDAKDSIRDNMYLSLLDEEISFSNLKFNMKYYIMYKKNRQKVLIIQADLNQEDTAEQLFIERENLISDMLIAVVAKSDMFFSDLESYYAYCQTLDELDDQKPFKETIFSVLRRIHTFKGVFDQYHMVETCRGLNNVETELFNILHNLSEMNSHKLSRMLVGYSLDKIIDADLNIIKNRLGNSFLDSKFNTSINMTDLNRLVIAVGDEIGHNHILVKELETLQYVDVRSVLKSYEKYVQRIAEETSKEVIFVVIGDSIRIDRKYYIDFFESILHIFKNCVAHGVEYPDERRSKGKNEVATISCHVKTSEDVIIIEISDDGKGIDLKEIKNRLFILGKYTIEELESFSDDYIANLILEDGVSSMSLPNNLAGKGVGMGSVVEVIEKLGGHICVTTQRDEGVTYSIELPKGNSLNDPLELENLHEEIALQAESIITGKSRKMTLNASWTIDHNNLSEAFFKDVTVQIMIEGMTKHYLVITADEKLLIHLINIYKLSHQYKGSNIKILNEALLRFAEELTYEEFNLGGFRDKTVAHHGEILSERILLERFGHQKGRFGNIDVTEGHLGIWVI